MTVLFVLLGVLLLFCCTPVGIVGVRYLTMENGPHKALPNICAVVNKDELTSMVGDVDGQRQKPDVDDEHYELCRWVSKTRMVVSMSATLYHKSIKDNSLDKARHLYKFDVDSEATSVGGVARAVSYLNGVGQDGQCFAKTLDWVNVEIRCVARDGNVLLDADISPPIANPDKVPQDQRLDGTKLTTLLDNFTRDVAGKLMNDLVEDLD